MAKHVFELKLVIFAKSEISDPVNHATVSIFHEFINTQRDRECLLSVVIKAAGKESY